MDQKVKTFVIILIAVTLLSLGISYLQYLDLGDSFDYVATPFE
ncbi:MAG: hypothetical protein ACFFCS_11880 [Candidatus Hodarchaeota archaeon]